LDSYFCVGSMTNKFPVSVLAIMALFFFSMDLIDCISQVSG
jgi:hypothetical protein